MTARVWLPILTALLALAASLGAAFEIHASAASALDRELHDRLRATAVTGAMLLTGAPDKQRVISELMRVHGLDGAYVVGPNLRVIADATGERGGRVDLLRADPAALERAMDGTPSVQRGYMVGELPVYAAYAPLPGAPGVLVIEAGQSFARPKRQLRNALWIAAALSLLGAAAVAIVGLRWVRAERQRAQDAERAARGEALTRIAAAAAHEIRNPLGVMRATVELMRERSGAALGERDRQALEDVLDEVQRLRRLTDDLLDLSADRPLAKAHVDLPALLREAAEATERLHPEVKVALEVGAIPAVEGDPGRLRQVLANLLSNAAQAQRSGPISLRAEPSTGGVRIEVKDQGPGVAAQLRGRLFEPFATGKEGGTGLGLALSKRLIERHGGKLALVDGRGPGATFEIWLPTASDGGA